VQHRSPDGDGWRLFTCGCTIGLFEEFGSKNLVESLLSGLDGVQMGLRFGRVVCKRYLGRRARISGRCSLLTSGFGKRRVV